MKRPEIEDSIDHVSGSALRETSLGLVPTGSVLLVVRGMILAHSVPVASTTVPVTINQDMKALVPHDGVLQSKFFRYSLEGLEAGLRALVEEAGHGTRCLRSELWRRFEVPLPPLPTQRAIADFLDRKTAQLDALIEKKQKLLHLLAEKRAALIHQAVTKGLDPDVPRKDSGIPWIGEIPAHWEVRRLKHLCKLESGHTPSRGDPSYWIEEECTIPWVSLNDSRKLKRADWIDETAVRISPRGMANSSAHLISEGAVVFTRDASIGLAAILTRPMAVSQHIIGWVCGPSLHNRYLLRVVDCMAGELDRLTFGATLRTIGMADVKSLVTPCPPVEEQAEIVDYLDSTLGNLERTNRAVRQQLDRIREYRQGLITAAVTGQLDIEGDHAA